MNETQLPMTIEEQEGLIKRMAVLEAEYARLSGDHAILALDHAELREIIDTTKAVRMGSVLIQKAAKPVGAIMVFSGLAKWLWNTVSAYWGSLK